MKWYGLYGPSGKLRSVHNSRLVAWCNAFYYQTTEFRQEYWNRFEASQKAMKRLGWNVVAGSFTPNKRKAKR